MTDFQKNMVSLIRSGITSEPAVLTDSLNWLEVLKCAETYQIASVIYYGVHRSGIKPPDDIYKTLKALTYNTAAIDNRQNYELSELSKAFSENNIDYMPLKGIILKKLYPNSEMRFMSDMDILIKVDQYSVISQIMKNLGYSETGESDHELIWKKPQASKIELHKRLISSYNKDYYKYYGDGWRLARLSEQDGCHYELRDEDQFIYLFTHFAKHYRAGGIGIKHLIDFGVFLNKHPALDKNYIETELTKLQLYKFYINIMETLSVWFDDASPDDITDFITNQIFTSGAYGTHDAKIIASAVKEFNTEGSATGARRKKMLHAVFSPFTLMQKKYPILKKAPVLLPFFWGVRIIQVVLFRRDSIKLHRKNMNIMTTENIDGYHDDLNYVGLDFNFNE